MRPDFLIVIVWFCPNISISDSRWILQERDRRDSEIDADLTAASTLALRMVMTIAKIYGLRPGDLQD